jgi:hypothetical protein
MNYVIVFFIIFIIIFFSFEKKKENCREKFRGLNYHHRDDTIKYLDVYTPLKYSYPNWYNRITPLPFNNPTKLYYYNDYYPYLYSYFYPQSVLY